MIPTLSADIITFSIQSDRMLEAGRRYFEQGRVSDLRVEEEHDTVTAFVRGSGRIAYCVTIVFDDDDDEFGGLPATFCTCPVGMGCKHVAATFLAFQAMNDQEQEAHTKPRLLIETKEPAQRPIAGPLSQWLDDMAIEDLALRLKPEELCFTLEPRSIFKPTKRPGKGAVVLELPDRYTLHVKAWRRAPNESQWRTAHPWEAHQGRAHLRPEAARLLSRMTHAVGGDFTTKLSPNGVNGWSWLWEASVGSLLRWQTPDGPEITVDRGHHVSKLCWETLADGSQVVALEATGRDPDKHLVIAGDPPIYFDAAANTLSLIDAGKPMLVGRLLAMPPVAVHEVSAVAARWKEIAHDCLPPPALPAAASVCGSAPRPVLRCVIEKVSAAMDRWSSRSRSPAPSLELARLEFDYEGHRVRAQDAAAEIIAPSDSGVVRIIRDIAAEQAAADRLAQTALAPLAFSPGYTPKTAQSWDHVFLEDPHGADQRFWEFLVNDAQGLRNEGWLIEFGPRWPHVLIESDEGPSAPAIDVSPHSPGKASNQTIDWFDVELSARIEGDQRIDILPALRRLLASGVDQILERDDAYRIAVPLGAGRFTGIQLGAVRPLIETIVRMALVDRSATTLKLSSFDLGIIHDLANAGLPWASHDRLRVLAARLNAPQDQVYVPPEGLHATLRAYQATGCSWLAALHEAGMGGILADDMGLGKTLQAIAHLLAVHSRTLDSSAAKRERVVIVAPTSVLPNWQAEIARFAPTMTCVLWHGAERHQLHSSDFSGGDVVLTTYALLARDAHLFAAHRFAVVVLDEAHVLKNPKTAGFKAAAKLKARQIIALTGTPVENRLTDLWSLASLTNPGLLGSYEDFRTRYRTPIEKHDDPTARAALARRIRPFMLRRTKDAVASDLPAKTIIPERIELATAQLRLYESQRLLMHKRVREEIDRVGLTRSQIVVLDAMLKLRQICCDPVLLPGGLGAEVASAKRERLMEMVPELIAEGRRIIIFSQFTAMLDLIAADLDEHGLSYEQLRGSTRDRARPVRRFQDCEVPIILVSLKAGGAGVNLTSADTVILYDPWWNPAVEAQAIDRAHRIGQVRPVFVHRLIARATIEEKILALQERKQGLADLLWDEKGSAGSSSLTDADIDFLLG